MNKLLYSLIITVSLGFLSSCDDNLNVTNPNAQNSDGFWQTESEVAEGVIAIYNRLITDGCYARMTPSLLDLRGDDTYSTSPWTIYPLSGNFTVMADYDVLLWPWREYYIMVRRANLVLEKSVDVEFTDENYKNSLLGQTYFLRAFAYYQLTEMYESVPLILEVQSDPADYNPSAATREEILAQIETDLTKAVDMLPATQTEKGRVTSGSAAALLARVYMLQQNWVDAEKALSSIITSGQYSLVDNYGDNFTYANENNSESLFEVQFGNFGTAANWAGLSVSDWRQGNAIGNNYGMSEFTAWGDIRPTQWLYDQFKLERTEDGLLDPRLYYTLVSYEEEYDTYTDGRSNTVFGKNPYTDGGEADPQLYPRWVDGQRLGDSIFIAKWTHARIPGHTMESNGIDLGSTINIRIIRYAEVLLNYAETLCMRDRHTEAVAYINEIRRRAGLSDFTSTNNDEIWAELMHQRVLELSIEGIRGYDIRRWGWFENNLEELKSHDYEFNTWVKGKEFFPIPSYEMDVNQNLEGNSNNKATN